MRLLRLAVFLFTLCAALAGITRTLMTSLPLDPDALIAVLSRNSNHMDQVWCWRDICPDHTLLREASQRIEDFHHSDAHSNAYSVRWIEPATTWKLWAETLKLPSLMVERIMFVLPEGKRFPLGEAITLYGTPQRVFHFRNRVAGLYWMSVCFESGVCVEVRNMINRLTPRLQVFAIFYRSPAIMADRVDPDGDELVQVWRGFRTRLL